MLLFKPFPYEQPQETFDDLEEDNKVATTLKTQEENMIEPEAFNERTLTEKVDEPEKPAYQNEQQYGGYENQEDSSNQNAYAIENEPAAVDYEAQDEEESSLETERRASSETAGPISMQAEELQAADFGDLPGEDNSLVSLAPGELPEEHKKLSKTFKFTFVILIMIAIFFTTSQYGSYRQIKHKILIFFSSTVNSANSLRNFRSPNPMGQNIGLITQNPTATPVYNDEKESVYHL